MAFYEFNSFSQIMGPPGLYDKPPPVQMGWPGCHPVHSYGVPFAPLNFGNSITVTQQATVYGVPYVRSLNATGSNGHVLSSKPVITTTSRERSKENIGVVDRSRITTGPSSGLKPSPSRTSIVQPTSSLSEEDKTR